jgi:hypothetical protein
LRKLVSMEFSVSMIYLNIDHLLEILFLYWNETQRVWEERIAEQQ